MKRFSSPSAIALIGILLAAEALHANPYRLQYGGRITQSNGQPIQGTASILVSFFQAATGGTLLASQTFNAVPLTDGIFSLSIELTPAEFHTVFSATEAWVEITDVTSGTIYPRQRFSSVPYAFKVPVDGTTIGYTSTGQLSVQGIAGQPLPTGSPADGQVLKWRSASGWEWGSDEAGSTPGAIDSTALQDGSIVNADISATAAIAGTKISPNFGSQNIVTTGIISGNGSGLTNLPAGVLGSSIDSSEITDASLVDADISATAAIAQSKISGLTTSLAAKEAAITAGTSAQYLRGDKTWDTLDTSVVPEDSNLYFTDARARAAISGTAPVAYNSTTGAISMAAATSVGNGYLSSSDWLTFNSKQAAITATSALNTGSLSTALQKGLEIKPFDGDPGETGELRFNELSGSNYIGFKAPDTIAADKIWTLPAADGSSGQFLSTNGSGVLSWSSVAGGSGGTVTSIAAGTGLSGGTITGSGTIGLNDTTVTAGAYTRANITVDAQGRLTAAASGSSVNLSSEVTGTLPVGNGGTGLSAGTSGGLPYYSSTSTMASSAALTANGVVLGGGAGAAPASTAAGSAYQTLRVPSGGGAPVFGALDLSQSAAVANALGVGNGGTGLTSGTSGGVPYFSAAGTMASSAALTARGIVLGGGAGAAPSATAALSSGQLLIGSTAADPVAATLSQGSNAGVTISNGAGSITLDTVQDIRTSATPTFAGVSLGSGSITATNLVAGSGDGGATPSGGSVRAANGAGANIAGGNITIAPGNGTGTGGSGSIIFQTAPDAASSSTANTMATRMTIDKAGNVGIGTAVPMSKLTVDSGGLQVSGNNYVHEQGTYLQWNRSGGDGETWLINQKGSGNGNAGIRFGSATTLNAVTEYARIDDIGRFGIGTSTPLLNLAGAANGDYPTGWGGLHLGGHTHEIVVIDGAESSRLHLTDGNGAAGNKNVMMEFNGGKLGISSLGDNLGCLHCDIMVVDGVSGNVGIGTTSVNAKVHIKTPSGVNYGAGQTNSGLLISDSDGIYGLTIASGGKGNASGNLGWNSSLIGVNAYYDFTTDTIKRYSVTGAMSDSMAITMTADNAIGSGTRMGFWTSENSDPTERVSITKNGNVGIGTSAPTSALQVNGIIKSAKPYLVARSTSASSGTSVTFTWDSVVSQSTGTPMVDTTNATTQTKIILPKKGIYQVSVNFHSYTFSSADYRVWSTFQVYTSAGAARTGGEFVHTNEASYVAGAGNGDMTTSHSAIIYAAADNDYFTVTSGSTIGTTYYNFQGSTNKISAYLIEPL